MSGDATRPDPLPAGADRATLRRLERRMYRRLDVIAASRRLVESIPATVQIVVAVVVSYSFAHFVLGHATPLLSITVVLTTLGFRRDARPRRVLDSAVGILVGIVLSELMVAIVGHGVWQIALVLAVTLLVARTLSASDAIAAAAGVQGMLVMILPVPAGGPFVRSIDGLVGGVVALLVTALIPRDPRRIALRDARGLVSAVEQSLASMIEGLRDDSEPAASLGLERLRRTQSLIDDWSSSLETAIAVARLSPFLRRHLPALRRQAELQHAMDLAVRHLRVIGRRVFFLVQGGGARPEVAELLVQLAGAIAALGATADARDAGALARPRGMLEAIAPRLDPAVILPGAPVSEGVIVMLVRPLVVDLLVATGMTADEARELLPPV
ncbi:FUSC family protein [Galbitalea soli]|uniref:FUSC family protein n=1 Tax=Galbitalea soli TaxID=1268042 RepID=A0A7C9PPS1_9MICO|nr:FUSC family protein [Galbitalea soli]NEM92328.1 FUSC family protein [Galbitalea soli]NYJ31715.1 uncharacterized membrane protein YgaE (UPF0421/DUF939 family) [Galbitalea soli]